MRKFLTYLAYAYPAWLAGLVVGVVVGQVTMFSGIYALLKMKGVVL